MTVDKLKLYTVKMNNPNISRNSHFPLSCNRIFIAAIEWILGKGDGAIWVIMTVMGRPSLETKD